jgi:hypothetical protein
MGSVVELDLSRGRGPAAQIFELLSKQDAVIVLRNVPEIRRLGATIVSVATAMGSPALGQEVAHILQTREIPSLEALSLLYRALHHLRDSRYISALFSDLVGSCGLPQPMLIDSGYYRMAIVDRLAEAASRPDLFEVSPLIGHPNEAETMLVGPEWGQAHRDLGFPHYHFQLNFWFPLHDIDAAHSLPIFPAVYRSAAPEYTQPSDPDPNAWGYGPALQVPLRFGDTLLFHSEQLHGSPPSGGRNRLSVELRVAAACIDDNAKSYRRLFWNIENFLAAGQGADAADRADEIGALPPGDPKVGDLLAAQTAHAVFNGLFRKRAVSLAAGFVRRPDAAIADTVDLGPEGFAALVDRLIALPCGEDLLLATSRLLIARRHQDLGRRVLLHLIRRSRSYFWLLEVGRVAADAGWYDVAATAFGAAVIRAETAPVALGRYTAGLAPPRPNSPVKQLLPRVAKRAAVALRRRAEIEQTQGKRTTVTFDHSLFWPPEILASLERHDVLLLSNLLLVLPLGRAFHPEQILDNGENVAVGYEIEDLARSISEPLGQKANTLRPVTGPAVVAGEYILQVYLNGWYAIPRAHGAVDYVSDDVMKIPGVIALHAAAPAADAAQKLIGLAGDIAHAVEERGQLQYLVENVFKRGATRSLGKLKVDEDFVSYAFYDDRAALAAALRAVVGKPTRPLRLIGPSRAVDDLVAGLRNDGHNAEAVYWSYADPIPDGGLRDGILCETPKTFADWAKFSSIEKSGGRLVPIWRLVLPWSLPLELLSNYQYTVKTLDEVIANYQGSPSALEAMIVRLEKVFPLRGRTVLEFGPSWGNHTSGLVAAGAAHITTIEGRPENALKLLVAKYVMGWDNVDLVLDNFQSFGPWAERRYDIVYAQGVYYHCQNPFVFFDGLTKLSDAVMLGGWCCDDRKPARPWDSLQHEGESYRAKAYAEDSLFLSGLGLTSYMLDKGDIQAYFARHGYQAKYCEARPAHDNPHELGAEYVEIFFVKE